MTDYPLVGRQTPVSVVPSFIPLHYVHPGPSPTQIVSILWAHRRLSILIALLVLALAAVAYTLWPRTYTGVATLMVNYEINDPLNGKELPVGQVGSYIATQVELMQTPAVLLAVVDRLDLTLRDEYVRGYRAESGTVREWAAAKVRRELAVYPSQRGGQLIYVTYSAPDRAEAAAVVNAVIDVYKEQDVERSSGPPADRARRYAQQLSDLKAKVNRAQSAVTSYLMRSGVVDEGNKTNVGVVLLATLEGRLIDAQNARRSAETRAADNQAVSDQVLASTHVQALKTQIAAQELRLAHLQRNYTADYPDVREARLQLLDTRRTLASVVGSYAANASAGLNAARRLEGQLKQAVGEQRTRVLEEGRQRDEASKHLLELDVAQTVYKRALDAYDRIMFASSDNRTNVSLVSRAAPPVKAEKPKLPVALALAALAACTLGLGVPLLYELFNRRVRCRDDFERHQGVTVLAEFGRLPRRGLVRT